MNRLIKSIWNIAMCVTIDYMCSYMTKRKAVASPLLRAAQPPLRYPQKQLPILAVQEGNWGLNM